MHYNRRALSKIIAQKTLRQSGDSLANEVAAYLVTEKHVSDLDLIMREVLDYRFEQGFIEATLVTAHQLDDSHKTEATHLLKELFPAGKHYTVHTRLDPITLGGVKLLVAGKQIDFTLKNKLSRLKRLTAA